MSAVIYARLTAAEGTAASETAVCGECRRTRPVHILATLYAHDTVTGWVDCSGNEALSCQLCGAVSDDMREAI